MLALSEHVYCVDLPFRRLKVYADEVYMNTYYSFSQYEKGLTLFPSKLVKIVKKLVKKFRFSPRSLAPEPIRPKNQ